MRLTRSQTPLSDFAFPPSTSGTSFQSLDAYLSIRRFRRRAAMNLYGNDSRWHDRLVVLLEVDRLQSVEPNLHARAFAADYEIVPLTRLEDFVDFRFRPMCQKRFPPRLVVE